MRYWPSLAEAVMLMLLSLVLTCEIVFTTSIASDQLSTERARVLGVDINTYTITLVLVGEGRKLFVPAADAQKALGRTPEQGDVVQVVREANDTVQDLAIATVVPSLGRVIATLVIGAAVVIGAAMIASRFHLRKFLIGADNRYSNSKCQVALWFGTIATAYLATLYMRVWAGGLDYVYGVSYPTNALVLTGLSALTYAGAKTITSQKVENPITNEETPSQIITPGTGRNNAKKAATKPSAVKPNILEDLFQDDYGQVDIGDFQMIFMTLIAVVIYLIICFNSLTSIPLQAHVSLPDVDTSLLGGFGLSQGAYLLKKAASPPGKG